MTHSHVIGFILGLTLATGLSFCGYAEATEFRYDVEIVEVIDGDTVKAINPAWPAPLNEIAIRVDSVDTPEKGFRAKCAKEADLGEKATLFAKETLKPKMIVKVVYDTKHKDKFGRVLSDITMPDGKLYSQMLIKAGLAREYHGESKGSWCE